MTRYWEVIMISMTIIYLQIIVILIEILIYLELKKKPITSSGTLSYINETVKTEPQSFHRTDEDEWKIWDEKHGKSVNQ